MSVGHEKRLNVVTSVFVRLTILIFRAPPCLPDGLPLRHLHQTRGSLLMRVHDDLLTCNGILIEQAVFPFFWY